MNCPACSNTLSVVKVNNVDVDICSNGCAGVWFDNYELKKFDEAHEDASSVLLNVPKDPQIKVNFSEKRPCPKCENVTMMRHFFSVKNKVEMDECGVCGGIWLDDGELNELRSLFKDENDKMTSFEVAFDSIFGDELKEIKDEHERIKVKREKQYISNAVYSYLSQPNLSDYFKWG